MNVIDGAIDGSPPDGLSVQLEQDLHGIAIKTIDECFSHQNVHLYHLYILFKGIPMAMFDYRRISKGVGQQLEVDHINVRCGPAADN